MSDRNLDQIIRIYRELTKAQEASIAGMEKLRNAINVMQMGVPEASEAGEPQPGDGKTCGECELWESDRNNVDDYGTLHCSADEYERSWRRCLHPNEFRHRGGSHE